MEVNFIKTEKLKQKPDFNNLIFGRVTTDYMFTMEYQGEKGWNDAKIEPYGAFMLDPSTHSLHYGQEIFEGLKAYRNEKNDVYLFRPIDNLNRMNKSATRMCMPEIDAEFVLKALKQLIDIEKEWIPTQDGSSLYIRPTMIATAPQLGVKAGNYFKFFIILSPVGPYFGHGMNAVDLLVEETLSRCAKGGTGEAKCAGNYAAGMLAAEEAAKKGYSQILWLDAAEKKYVEEAGVMNIFFVVNDELITPSLTGTILRGITRDSVIKLMKHQNYKVTERMITIEEIAEFAKNGSLSECFAVGTAAVVCPIKKLHYKNSDILPSCGNEVGPIAKSIHHNLCSIQIGEKEDPFGWVVKIESN
jgi:branched-chain amino acid aminotransferase